MRRICVPALAIAVVLGVLATSVTDASAVSPTTQAWQSSTCFSSACQWSNGTGDYVTGGDGTSIGDYLGGSWGSLDPIQQTSTAIETEAVGEVPLFSTVAALSTITLAATAFAAGWEIGSTANTKWLHIEGVGLGETGTETPPSCSPETAGGHWSYVSNLQSQTSNSSLPSAPGALFYSSAGSLDPTIS